MNSPPLPNSNLEFKYSISTIYIIVYLASLLTASATEVEINATVEDNIVILLDYSASATNFRPYIQSNAVYSVQNIQADVNVSVVVYGSNVYSVDYQDNRTILEEFIYNISGKEGYASRDNITGGFDTARNILNNSTGSKQIIMFSEGNIDGKTKGKLNNEKLLNITKEIRKSNVTINLYQQLDTTKITPILKKAWIREPYKDLSDTINTEVVILNSDERIRFLKPKLPILPSEPSRNITIEVVDEYLNEFSNNGETSSIIFSMNYDPSEALSNERDLSHATKINFYSYCDQNQTCTIIPFDIQQRRFLEKQIADVFRSKNAIELVKSGNITESAYIFSNSISGVLCGFFDSDTLNEESINFLGEALPSIEPKTKTPIKVLRLGRFISKVDYPMLIASGVCEISNDDELLVEIINGGRFTYNLKNIYAYNGITRDFQIYNKGLMNDIEYRKTAYLGILQIPYMLNIGIIYNAEPLVKNNNVKLTQLLYQDYKEDAESAVIRMNYKSKESQIFIDNATSELNKLNSQIPFELTEKFLNFIEEPETNYSIARLRQTNADDYLNKANENQTASKFNSAIQNSNNSLVQSREGMVIANVENSKQRHFKLWVWLFGG
jgi:hypothetical protein